LYYLVKNSATDANIHAIAHDEAENASVHTVSSEEVAADNMVTKYDSKLVFSVKVTT